MTKIIFWKNNQVVSPDSPDVYWKISQIVRPWIQNNMCEIHWRMTPEKDQFSLIADSYVIHDIWKAIQSVSHEFGYEITFD